MKSTTVHIDDRRISLSNLDKVLYPETGFTKGQLINYYVQLADTILPHITNRPITLKRYPEGVDKDYFYEKQCPSHKPDWMPAAHLWSRHNEGYIDYCLIDTVSALVWLANLASIEIHPSLATADNYSHPTLMAFDLDPTLPADISDCCDVALLLRDMLGHLGLQSFIKTSGGKGLHLYVPINMPETTYSQTKHFSNAIAGLLEQQYPDRITSNMRKGQRIGKVLVDWSQNDQHKTTVAVYSVRALNHPFVSTPVTWREIENVHRNRKTEKLSFETSDVIERVKKQGDIFAPVLTLKQKLPHV
jgi:bifunctional non-homologous end joining protein LigD